MTNQPATIQQPAPMVVKGRAISDLVRSDIEMRAREGERKYGTRLKAHNGRDGLIDAYQEVLDLACYLRQVIEERNTRPEKSESERAFEEWKSCNTVMEPNLADRAFLGGWNAAIEWKGKQA